MTHTLPTKRPGEAGFTLVELAIVMIIIGLLIGGILKGQELVSNAQVAATVSQIKSIDAGISTFRDKYDAMPGDMVGPATRIPNCAAGCAQDGDANGRIGNDPGAAHANITNENGAAWSQLSAADILSGVDSSAAPAAVVAAGVTIPEAEISSASYQIGYTANGALTALAGPNARAGHYLLLDNSLAAVTSLPTATPPNPGTMALSPNQAFRIDNKIDDGQPNVGSVRAAGGGAAGACASTATTVGIYNEAEDAVLCGLYIRVQQ